MNNPMSLQATAMSAQSFTANEMEFLAENELIDIEPEIRTDEFALIDDQKFGPLRPRMPTKVPLWLACYLKKARRCKINPPEWLTPEWLSEQFRLEHESPKQFQPMPPKYLEIANILLREAADNIPNVNRVRACLKDLEDVRQSKIRSGLQQIQPGIPHILMRNISSMELHPIRGFCITTLNAMKNVTVAPGGDSQSADSSVSATSATTDSRRGVQVQNAASGQYTSVSEEKDDEF